MNHCSHLSQCLKGEKLMNIYDKARCVTDEEEENYHEENDGLLRFIGFPLGRGECFSGSIPPVVVHAWLLQLLRWSVHKLTTSLDDPIDSIV